MIVPLFVGREKSIRALEEVMKADKFILLATQKNATDDDPTTDAIYTSGTLASVLQLLKLPDGTVKVLVEGTARAAIRGYGRTEDYYEAEAELGVIRVERSWDPHAGVIEPKSRAGRRSVPIVAALRPHLAARKLRRVVPPASSSASAAGRSTATRSSTGPTRAWKKAGLDPIGLHECRHTLASILIAAGVTAKALSTYLGHSSTQITLDRYGHLMPGNEDEAVALVDAYLRRATASS